jgi:hypothetical protein
MWRVIRFVLTPKNSRDPGTHASHGLIGTVYNIPVALYGSRIRMLGGEM